MREIRTSGSMRGGRKRAFARRACLLLYGDTLSMRTAGLATIARYRAHHEFGGVWGRLPRPRPGPGPTGCPWAGPERGLTPERPGPRPFPTGAAGSASGGLGGTSVPGRIGPRPPGASLPGLFGAGRPGPRPSGMVLPGLFGSGGLGVPGAGRPGPRPSGMLPPGRPGLGGGVGLGLPGRVS